MTRIRTLVHYTNPPALAGGCSVVDVDDLATRMELVRKSFNGGKATIIIAQEYVEIFGHIHEICRDSSEAHRIVEQLVKRLKL